MQKMKLELGDLRVQSFTTTGGTVGRGTVEGRMESFEVSGCACPAPDPEPSGAQTNCATCQARPKGGCSYLYTCDC